MLWTKCDCAPRSEPAACRARVRRERADDAHKPSALGGLAALSLDTLSSVAYGPGAI